MLEQCDLESRPLALNPQSSWWVSTMKDEEGGSPSGCDNPGSMLVSRVNQQSLPALAVDEALSPGHNDPCKFTRACASLYGSVQPWNRFIEIDKSQMHLFVLLLAWVDILALYDVWRQTKRRAVFQPGFALTYHWAFSEHTLCAP